MSRHGARIEGLDVINNFSIKRVACDKWKNNSSFCPDFENTFLFFIFIFYCECGPTLEQVA